MGLATKETDLSVDDFIESIENVSKKQDSKILIALMEKISGYKPKIWGDYFIIGFGNYTYTRKNSKEKLNWFHLGFAPRKTKITIYLTFDINREKQLIDKLGKCKHGKGCLYINKLTDINIEVLEELLIKSKDAKWH